MIGINPTVSVMTLNVSGLNVLITRHIVRVNQKTRPNYMLLTRNILNIKTHVD